MKSLVYYIIFLLLFLFSCGKEKIVKPTETIIVTNPLPLVTTKAASDVFVYDAISGGNISSDGGYSIIARGVCWSTNQNPTISDSKTIDGTGIGEYTSLLTNLSSSSIYYLRAYATNYKGTGYGDVISITTNPAVPEVTTNSITNIQPTSATCGGIIYYDFGYSITTRGVCWSTNQNPTTSDSKTINGTGTGSFSSSITGLAAGSTYYVRAYATNSMGTGYGNTVSFTTGSSNGSIENSYVINQYVAIGSSLLFFVSISGAPANATITSIEAKFDYTAYGTVQNYASCRFNKGSDPGSSGGVVLVAQGSLPSGNPGTYGYNTFLNWNGQTGINTNYYFRFSHGLGAPYNFNINKIYVRINYST